MTFANHNVLDTLSKTLHPIFCVSSSVGDVDDIVDAISSHRQKVCEDTVKFLEYKRDFLLWSGRHSLDACMSEGRKEYLLWKRTQQPLSLETFEEHLLQLYTSDGFTVEQAQEEVHLF